MTNNASGGVKQRTKLKGRGEGQREVVRERVRSSLHCCLGGLRPPPPPQIFAHAAAHRPPRTARTTATSQIKLLFVVWVTFTNGSVGIAPRRRPETVAARGGASAKNEGCGEGEEHETE